MQQWLKRWHYYANTFENLNELKFLRKYNQLKLTTKKSEGSYYTRKLISHLKSSHKTIEPGAFHHEFYKILKEERVPISSDSPETKQMEDFSLTYFVRNYHDSKKSEKAAWDNYRTFSLISRDGKIKTK